VPGVTHQVGWPKPRSVRRLRSYTVGWHVDQGPSARVFIFIPFGDRGDAISASNREVHELAINIGAMPILFRTDTSEFARLLEGELSLLTPIMSGDCTAIFGQVGGGDVARARHRRSRRNDARCPQH
jgi:hypothetical protein